MSKQITTCGGCGCGASRRLSKSEGRTMRLCPHVATASKGGKVVLPHDDGVSAPFAEGRKGKSCLYVIHQITNATFDFAQSENFSAFKLIKNLNV